MITKEVKREIECCKKRKEAATNRIKKVQKLSKLSSSKELIEEFDGLIKNCENAIFETLNKQEIPDAHKEQVRVRGFAKVRETIKMFKQMIEKSELTINYLNDSIAKDNETIQKLLKSNKEGHNEIV